MSKRARAQMVLAMETVARNLNDEDIFEVWLMNGVADGDLNANSTWEDVDDYYLEGANFADLMATFARMMRYANEDDNLDEDDIKKGNEIFYCDGVVSKKDRL